MKLSLEQLASIESAKAAVFLGVTGIDKQQVEKYVRNQMNTYYMLRAKLNNRLNRAGKDHIDDTIEVLQFIEDKLELCQKITNNFQFFVRDKTKDRPMSVAWAKQIIDNL